MDYEQLLIEEFDDWKLYLHPNQYPYIGRCYAWSKHDDAKTVDDMLPKATFELFHIILPDWRLAMQELYQPIRSNVSIMCNETLHLHAHLIPRYDTPRIVHDITFFDHNPDGNYAPYAKPKLSEEFLQQVKADIAAHLPE